MFLLKIKHRENRSSFKMLQLIICLLPYEFRKIKSVSTFYLTLSNPISYFPWTEVRTLACFCY